LILGVHRAPWVIRCQPAQSRRPPRPRA